MDGLMLEKHRQKLSEYSIETLRNYCRKLSLTTHGYRSAIEKRLVDFLTTPYGKNHAFNVLDSIFLSRFYADTPTAEIASNNGYDIQWFWDLRMGGTIIQCRSCKKYQHKQWIGNSYAIKPYECALWQLYTFDPFYEIKDALTKPSLVQSYSPHVLFYSHQLKNEVYQAKGDKQIQIRCLKLDNAGYLNTWPAFGRLEVNHKLIREFKTNKNPNAKKRKDEPMNITILLQEGKNQISLIKELDDFTYVLGIFMVEKKSPESIVFNFRRQNIISYNQGLDFIITKLQQSTADVESSSIKLSLKCPYSMTLMTAPVRGIQCKHPQWFDLEPFIQLQAASNVNKWRCPICKGHAFKMVADEYMLRIQEEAKKYEDPVYAEIFPNGSFRIITFEEQFSNQFTNPVLAPERTPEPIKPRSPPARPIHIEEQPIKKAKVANECKGTEDSPITLD